MLRINRAANPTDEEFQQANGKGAVLGGTLPNIDLSRLQLQHFLSENDVWASGSTHSGSKTWGVAPTI